MALTARYETTCERCKKAIKPGQEIEGTYGHWHHTSCLTGFMSLVRWILTGEED